MYLEIVTPNGSKLKEEVSEIMARSVLGDMGILGGHIPLLTVLDIGHFKFMPKGESNELMLALGGGYLEVDGDNLIVITESAEFANEIDVERAEAARSRAIKALETLESGSVAWQRKQRSLRRANSRIEIAGLAS